jgi:hypothetical protein
MSRSVCLGWSSHGGLEGRTPPPRCMVSGINWPGSSLTYRYRPSASPDYFFWPSSRQVGKLKTWMSRNTVLLLQIGRWSFDFEATKTFQVATIWISSCRFQVGDPKIHVEFNTNLLPRQIITRKFVPTRLTNFLSPNPPKKNKRSPCSYLTMSPSLSSFDTGSLPEWLDDSLSSE